MSTPVHNEMIKTKEESLVAGNSNITKKLLKIYIYLVEMECCNY